MKNGKKNVSHESKNVNLAKKSCSRNHFALKCPGKTEVKTNHKINPVFSNSSSDTECEYVLCVNSEKGKPDKIIYANMILEKKSDVPNGLWSYHQCNPSEICA